MLHQSMHDAGMLHQSMDGAATAIPCAMPLHVTATACSFVHRSWMHDLHEDDIAGLLGLRQSAWSCGPRAHHAPGTCGPDREHRSATRHNGEGHGHEDRQALSNMRQTMSGVVSCHCHSPATMRPTSSCMMRLSCRKAGSGVPSGFTQFTMASASPRRWRSCPRRARPAGWVVLGAAAQDLGDARHLLAAANHLGIQA